MYKLIQRPEPAKDLIAFKGVARRTYIRGVTKITITGNTYHYCAMQTADEIRVFKNESAFVPDYCNLNLLKIINLDDDKQLSPDDIYAVALTAI